MLHLTIKDDAVKCDILGGTNIAVFKSIKEWNAFDWEPFADEYTSFMCSSSINWPEDSTEDQDVIALCMMINKQEKRS